MGDKLPELNERWMSLPERVRFLVVGAIGVSVGWIVYNIIYFLNPFESAKATSSWVIAYILGVFRQHGLHYFLTFTESRTPYKKSLKGAFVAYSIGMLLSTIVNLYLNEEIGLNYNISWLFSVIFSVGINYWSLKKLAFD